PCTDAPASERMVRQQTSDGGGGRARPGRGEKSVALRKRSAVGLAAALSAVAALALAGPAFGADQRLVKAQDDCDPATFNAAVGPGTCVGEGRTLFADLLAQFGATGAVKGWDFSRPDFNIDAG